MVSYVSFSDYYDAKKKFCLEKSFYTFFYEANVHRIYILS